MRPTTAAAGAAALLLAAGLAACSGEPEPGSPLPTGEPVPSATGSAEPTGASPSTAGDPSASPTEQPVAVPTLPPEATTNDAAGAEAFVAYWYAISDYAALTGDVAAMREVAAETCATCERSADFIDERYASGGRFVGVKSTVSEVVSPVPGPDGITIPAYVLDQAASSVLDASGATLNEGAEAPERAYLQMALSWSGDGWMVEEIAS